MPSRDERLAALREGILSDASLQPAPATADELSRASTVAHMRALRGDTAPQPTEVTVRMHGAGVPGHLVAVDQATSLLKDLQSAISWIGSSARKVSDERAITKQPGERPGIRKATQLFLQPQMGAGSLIFTLVGQQPDAVAGAELTSDQDDPAAPTVFVLDSVLDEAVSELLVIFDAAEADDPVTAGRLTVEVRRMGALAASALDRVAEGMTKHEIDLDVGWSSPSGRQGNARIGRRGALALRDAVQASRTEVKLVEITGRMETASTGKDLVRIELVTGEDVRLAVQPDIGDTLGPLLGSIVLVKAEQTITSQVSGRVTTTYRLLEASRVPELPLAPSEPAQADPATEEPPTPALGQ